MWTKLKTQSQILLQVKGPGFFRLTHHQRCPARVSWKYMCSVLYAFNQIPGIKVDFLLHNRNDRALSICSGGSLISFSPSAMNYTNRSPLLPSYPNRRLMVLWLSHCTGYRPILLFLSQISCVALDK